jgi:hypothetical protein
MQSGCRSQDYELFVAVAAAVESAELMVEGEAATKLAGAGAAAAGALVDPAGAAAGSEAGATTVVAVGANAKMASLASRNAESDEYRSPAAA